MTPVGKVSCWVAACWIVLTTIPLAEIPIAPARNAPMPADAFDLLPESSVLVVELRDLADRWDEIRRVQAIARFQDRLLGEFGIDADELPKLVGNRALLALVGDDQRGELFPVAVLAPERPEQTLAHLAEIEPYAAVPLSVHRHGDLVSVAPAAFAAHFEGVPSEAHDALRNRLHVEEVAARLPEGGLVRGWVNPGPAIRMLKARPERTAGPLFDLFAELLVAKLEITRFAGFRRELTPRGLETEAVAGFDTAALPAEVREVFEPPATPRVMPRDMPPDVVASSVFGTEPRAVLAWLRHVASGAPRGTLRNLDFWLADLERGTGLDLEHDLLGLLGERAWAMVLRGDEGEPLRVAAVVETSEAERLEHNLLQVVPWIAGQVAGRTLGFAVPRVSDSIAGGEVVHTLSLATPLGEFPGPRFVFKDDRLILGSSDRALVAGTELARALDSPRPVQIIKVGSGPRPHETTVVSGTALADVVSTFVAENLSGDGALFANAVAELLAGLDEIVFEAWYEEDAVRMRGRLEFR